MLYVRMPVLVILCLAILLGAFAAPLPADPGNGDSVEQPTLAERIDDWFGTYVTDPLWNYFIAFPLFQSPAVEIYHGDAAEVDTVSDRLNRDAGIVTWTTELDPEADLHAVRVPVADQEEAAAFLQDQGFEPLVDGDRTREGGIPFIVILLLAGGVFFTLRFGLVNIRLFKHAFVAIAGRYETKREEGEISPFQALSSALSATVGLGNIAGVAIAIAIGGPGAMFWMWVSGFLGMSVKFGEAVLSQLYRRFDRKGHVLGGPMVYIDDGLSTRGGFWRPTAKVLAAAYAVFIMLSAFGVALFQTRTSYAIGQEVVQTQAAAWNMPGVGDLLAREAAAWAFGAVLAILVGIVVIGGIRRIGRVAAKLVPTMCVFYVLICLGIILSNIPAVPGLFATIFTEAFTGPAVFGGFIGVLVMGIRRGMFSNEAGIGSAAIAHAAARTREPVRQGLVAMSGPFIDTIVVCTMTALTIMIVGVHVGADPGDWIEGAALTATAFAEVHGLLAVFLVVAVLLFAYSTMISWSYYGDRGAEYLMGEWVVQPFRVVFVLLVLVGPLMGVANIVAFADVAFFAAVFPNIIAMVLLSGVVARRLKDYERRLGSGEIRPAGAEGPEPPTQPPSTAAAGRSRTQESAGQEDTAAGPPHRQE